MLNQSTISPSCQHPRPNKQAKECRACYLSNCRLRAQQNFWLRFWSKVRVLDDGCWEWTGTRDHFGYGKIGTGSITGGSLKMSMAHRVAYEALVGPIPDGLECDHLCHNPPCVNPRHIEAVSHRENIQRGFDRQPKPTHCPKGHSYSGSNLYRKRNGTLVCRRCMNGHRKLYLARLGADVRRQRHREYMRTYRQRAK